MLNKIVNRKPTDLCSRCRATRKEHTQKAMFTYAKSGFSSGGGHELPILAVTCGELSSCTAFIEPGEPVPKLGEQLPPKSREFFDIVWRQAHGNKTYEQVYQQYKNIVGRKSTPRAS